MLRKLLIVLGWALGGWVGGGLLAMLWRLDSSAPVDEASLLAGFGVASGVLLGLAHVLVRRSRDARAAQPREGSD